MDMYNNLVDYDDYEYCRDCGYDAEDMKEIIATRKYNKLLLDENMSSNEIIDIVYKLSTEKLRDCLIAVLKEKKDNERKYKRIQEVEELVQKKEEEIESLKLKYNEELENLKLIHQKEIEEIENRNKEKNRKNKEMAENYLNLYSKSLIDNKKIKDADRLKDIQINELTKERDIYKTVTDKINKKDLNQELNRNGKGLAFKEDISLSKVKELMLKGYKPKEIKDELNCSLATIYNRIKEIKEIERDIKKEEDNKEVEINSEDKTIESLYSRGYKVKEIVKILGVSQATVYRKVKEIKDKRAVKVESETERDT